MFISRELSSERRGSSCGAPCVRTMRCPRQRVRRAADGPTPPVTTACKAASVQPRRLRRGVHQPFGRGPLPIDGVWPLDGTQPRRSMSNTKSSDWSPPGTTDPRAKPHEGFRPDLFTFFAADNIELLVKVIDGCNLNQSHWALGAAATDVGYVLTVIDTATGETYQYSNRTGNRSEAIIDVEAFTQGCS